jgi:branched-chain amino acid aminotransferase
MLEAFGAGTAATIAHIKSVAFDGDEFLLPALENREYSNFLGKRLDDIRRGRVADTFDWLVPVH